MEGDQEEHASTQGPVFGASTDNREWEMRGSTLGAVHTGVGVGASVLRQEGRGWPSRAEAGVQEGEQRGVPQEKERATLEELRSWTWPESPVERGGPGDAGVGVLSSDNGK